jgi:hypothetical protein
MIAAAGFTPVLVLQASKGTRERQAQDHGVPFPDVASIVNTEIAAVGGNASRTSWKVPTPCPHVSTITTRLVRTSPQ